MKDIKWRWRFDFLHPAGICRFRAYHYAITLTLNGFKPTGVIDLTREKLLQMKITSETDIRRILEFAQKQNKANLAAANDSKASKPLQRRTRRSKTRKKSKKDFEKSKKSTKASSKVNKNSKSRRKSREKAVKLDLSKVLKAASAEPVVAANLAVTESNPLNRVERSGISVLTLDEWNNYFIDAGVNNFNAKFYALKFCEKPFSAEAIRDLTEDYLKDFGIIWAEDVSLILEHTRAVTNENKLKSDRETNDKDKLRNEKRCCPASPPKESDGIAASFKTLASEQSESLRLVDNPSTLFLQEKLDSFARKMKLLKSDFDKISEIAKSSSSPSPKIRDPPKSDSGRRRTRDLTPTPAPPKLNSHPENSVSTSSERSDLANRTSEQHSLGADVSKTWLDNLISWSAKNPKTSSAKRDFNKNNPADISLQENQVRRLADWGFRN